MSADDSIACLAIGYGETGVDDFMSGGYWKGPQDTTGPFIDPEPEPKAFKMFKTSSLGASGLFSWKTMKAVVGAKSPSDPSTKGGYQWNLGATVVMDLATGKLLFEHHQKGFADHPNIDAMLEACRDPAGPMQGG